jgi:hypothetical protein
MFPGSHELDCELARAADQERLVNEERRRTLGSVASRDKR